MPSPIRVERPGDYPRVHVPPAADLADLPTVESLLAELEERPLPDPAALQRWMRDCDEVFACLGEESSRRQIGMTCATDDPEAEKRHLHVVHSIQPRVKPAAQRLARKYLDSPHRASLDREFLRVHDRNTETAVRLFRPENVDLEKQDALEGQKYQKLMGSLSVRWRGEERTLEQMARLQESTDRAEREESWRLVTERRLRERGALDGIYDRLVALRDEQARNAGFPDFVAYIYPRKLRFDYGPAECEAFHDAVEACAVPFLRELDARRRRRLALPALRPWDLAVDETGKAPLAPFRDTAELASRCRAIFGRVDPAFGESFGMLIDRGLLDLDSRRGKAPGGYQATLAEVRLPFIFMNAAGGDRDVFTLLHEGGHAFHSLAARDQPLLAYRHGPMEFCEVASMGMELLCSDKLDPFYGAEDAARSLRRKLEDSVSLFPWCATIDAFQHTVYRNPRGSAADRTVAWEGLMERFGHDVDWTGLEDARATLWHRQLHVFLMPFYYIEYAISQMGALQLWVAYRRDPKEAVARYRSALSLGGSRTLPEIFRAAGLTFDFSRRTLEPLVDEVRKVIEGLPE